jgi:hypothetical protein
MPVKASKIVAKKLTPVQQEAFVRRALEKRERAIYKLAFKNAGIEFCESGAPQPGHTKLFTKAFEASLHESGLSGIDDFAVRDYALGTMNIVFRLGEPAFDIDNYSELAIERIIAAAAAASKAICALCGEPARPSKRYRPHDAPVALCGSHTSAQIQMLLGAG